MGVLEEIEANISRAIDSATDNADIAIEVAKKAATGAIHVTDGAVSKAGQIARKYKLDEAAASAAKSMGQIMEGVARKHPLAGRAVEFGKSAIDVAGEMGSDIMESGFNKSDLDRDRFMLRGKLAEQGYDCWWQSFTGHNAATGEEKSFFLCFFAMNPALGTDAAILGQSKEAQSKGIRPSYLMVKAGIWGEDAKQLNRFFPWKEVSMNEGTPFSISADNCFLSETRSLGRVSLRPEEIEAHPEWMSDAGDLIWDLHIDKKIAFNIGYGAGKPMRDQEALQMLWHAEGMKTAYEGRVVYNGQIYMVRPETSFGYADKNWGSNFTKPWIWLASSDLTSKISGEKLRDSAFTIGGGRPRVGNLEVENGLLGAMWYEGEPYQFNFSHVWTLTKTRYKVKVGKEYIRWRMIQETPLSKMYTDIHCSREDMVRLSYETPDGQIRHRELWSGGTGTGTIKLYRKSLKKDWQWELVDEIEAAHVGCEYGAE